MTPPTLAAVMAHIEQHRAMKPDAVPETVQWYLPTIDRTTYDLWDPLATWAWTYKFWAAHRLSLTDVMYGIQAFPKETPMTKKTPKPAPVDMPKPPSDLDFYVNRCAELEREKAGLQQKLAGMERALEIVARNAGREY